RSATAIAKGTSGRTGQECARIKPMKGQSGGDEIKLAIQKQQVLCRGPLVTNFRISSGLGEHLCGRVNAHDVISDRRQREGRLSGAPRDSEGARKCPVDPGRASKWLDR